MNALFHWHQFTNKPCHLRRVPQSSSSSCGWPSISLVLVCGAGDGLGGMNDRLPKLRELYSQYSHGRSAVGAAEPVDPDSVEIDVAPAAEPAEGFGESDLESFYGLISQVKLNTYKLTQCTKKLKQVGNDYVKHMDKDDETKQAAERALNKEKEEASNIQQSTGKTFTELTKLEEIAGKDANAEGAPAQRMIASSSTSARLKWKDAFQAYIEAERSIDVKLRERIKRHIEIHEDRKPTEEEVDQKMDEGVQDIFAETMTSKVLRASLRLLSAVPSLSPSSEDNAQCLLIALVHRFLQADLQLARGVNAYAHEREAQVPPFARASPALC